MKTKLILIAIALSVLLTNCSVNEDWGLPYPWKFSIGFIDATTNKGLLDTVPNAYYHVDSIKFIGESGEVIYDPEFILDSELQNENDYQKFGDFVYAEDTETFGFKNYLRDYVDYSTSLNTTLYLYLNQYETDKIDIEVSNNGYNLDINYRNHISETGNTYISWFIKKEIGKN